MKDIRIGGWLAFLAGLVVPGAARGQHPGATETSYLPVAVKESTRTIQERMEAAKPAVMHRQLALLGDRYDLSDRPAAGVTMSRGKPVQEGVRVKLPTGYDLGSPRRHDPRRDPRQGPLPGGLLPLPHPNQAEGGMVFPQFHIDEIRRQEGRDLTRFDLDFDLPDHFLPEFPPPIYLTTRPDLGDVSQGKLVTLENYFELFNGILNPKQLEGLRLLVTPFPQQQFNATEDRRSAQPSRGVTCFDCHANGHTNGATHLAGDIRPQAFRHRIETPTLRGVNIQRLFGSQRALRSVEDFTEFEQRGAYFDGDHVIATKKGVNILDAAARSPSWPSSRSCSTSRRPRSSGIDGKLDPRQATPAELRGQELFFGKAQCATCHTPPYYTDNLMHNLKTERFFKPRVINGHTAIGDGPIKTFPLRGIKDSPPYLHDGRLLTLDDTVEFFNLILELRLSERERRDLVAFMRQL